MPEQAPPFISVEIPKSIKNESYDVTETVEGLYHEIFLDMQDLFNFSATIYKRKDGKWGPTTHSCPEPSLG